MTIGSALSRVVSTGTGSAKEFPFNAPVAAVTDLKVFTLVIATSVQTLQTRGGSGTYDYAVTINSSTRYATVTLNTNLPNTHKIVILRNVPLTQETDYVEGDAFGAETHEAALDKLTQIASQISEVADRSIKVQEASSTTSITCEELVADRVLNVNAAGTGIEMGPTTANLETLASISSDISTVAGIAANITTVKNNASNINAVAADATDIGAVAGKATEIGRLGTSDAVADLALLGTSDIVSDMNTLASSSNVSNMNTLAGVASNVTTVAGIASNVTTVAGVASNVTSVANVASNVTTVAGVASNVTTVAGVAANVTTVANNVAGVNSFADRYRIGTSDPDSSLNEGDLFYNSNDNNLKFYNGTAWTSIDTGLTDIIGDTSPQLGGNLDVKAREINTSTTNGNIILGPHGTGMIEVKGNTNGGTIKLNCENNSHGVKIKSPPHSAAQDYTLTLPSSITNNYYLKTDGDGNLSFAAVPVETKPTVANVAQTIPPATATTINITGSNFVTIPIVEFIKTTGAITRPNSVSFTNTTTLSVNVTLATGSYHVRIENPDGNAGRSTNNILTASTAPTFSTSAGSLGSVSAGASVSIDVDGSSDSTVAFSETTSVLTSNANTPAATMNLTLNSGTGVITGTAPSPTASTTYNFTLRLTDAESQTVDRAFSITAEVGMANSAQFNNEQ